MDDVGSEMFITIEWHGLLGITHHHTVYLSVSHVIQMSRNVDESTRWNHVNQMGFLWGKYVREVVLLPQVCYLQALSDMLKESRIDSVESACVSVPAHRDGSFAPQKYLSDFIY